MTAPSVGRGTFRRTCRTCGWSNTYQFAARADYSKRQHSCTKWVAKLAAQARNLERKAAVDRTPKPCVHKIANHQHGERTTYVLDRCRCLPCSASNAAYENECTRLKAYGRWDHYVDAEPSRTHIRSLTGQGMGLKRITAVSDVSQGLLWKLMYGKTQPDGSRTPSQRVRRDTEERILAIGLNLADGAKIPACGSRRRIQALMCLGYSQSVIAERVGMLPSNFSQTLHHGTDILVSTAKAIEQVYDDLSMTPNHPEDWRSKISASRSRRYAAEHLYVPPLAWDDDTIDNPFMEPQWVENVPHIQAPVDEVAVQRAVDGDRTVNLTKADRHEVVRRWQAAGRSLAEMERVTGINAHRYLDQETA